MHEGLKSHTAFYYAFAAVLTLVMIIIFWCIFRKLKQKRTERRRRRNFEDNGGNLLVQKLTAKPLLEDPNRFKLFSLEEINRATKNFSPEFLLGHGRGRVYKGKLEDGRMVAIKKVIVSDRSRVPQFITEVDILLRVSYIGVVSLIGCCMDKKHPVVIYDYIEDGRTLFDLIISKDVSEIPWTLRFGIIFDVAHALNYLHFESPEPVLHRDLSSSNVLINNEDRAILGDFGIAHLLTNDESHVTSVVRRGTIYTDPAVIFTNRYERASDVYSFGAIIVEILIGKVETENLVDILIPKNLDDKEELEFTAIAHLARECLDPVPTERPTMREIVFKLKKIQGSRRTTSGIASSSVVYHDASEYEEESPLISNRGGLLRQQIT
ncbi:hypothetical protein L1049_001724 [Liquidambar formosana]|uniref:Protein kinase domain-containing protein n=1 Tax=Liquidambar formosana TaxID=63359 RepID=A0AAP0R1V2_LIQFO